MNQSQSTIDQKIARTQASLTRMKKRLADQSLFDCEKRRFKRLASQYAERERLTNGYAIACVYQEKNRQLAGEKGDHYVIRNVWHPDLKARIYASIDPKARYDRQRGWRVHEDAVDSAYEIAETIRDFFEHTIIRIDDSSDECVVIHNPHATIYEEQPRYALLDEPVVVSAADVIEAVRGVRPEIETLYIGTTGEMRSSGVEFADLTDLEGLGLLTYHPLFFVRGNRPGKPVYMIVNTQTLAVQGPFFPDDPEMKVYFAMFSDTLVKHDTSVFELTADKLEAIEPASRDLNRNERLDWAEAVGARHTQNGVVALCDRGTGFFGETHGAAIAWVSYREKSQQAFMVSAKRLRPDGTAAHDSDRQSPHFIFFTEGTLTEYDEVEFARLIAHEVAHAIARENGVGIDDIHGPAWARIYGALLALEVDHNSDIVCSTIRGEPITPCGRSIMEGFLDARESPSRFEWVASQPTEP